jgi:predicted nucleic acid-binding protein
MILFIDSDIFLDILLERQPYNNFAMKLLSLPGELGYNYYTATHTLLNVHYVASKKRGKNESRQAIAALVKKISIIPDDKQIFEDALHSDFSDLEDAVQYCAAKSINTDFIITRNIKDYKSSTIPVLTAEQFLRAL